MPLRDDIQLQQIAAMKAKDVDSLSTIRMLTSAIKNVEIEKKEKLSDTDVQKVVAKQVKQLQDSIKDFESGNRQDLVEKAKKEISLLSKYLPTQMADSELKSIVENVIEQAGAIGSKDAGKVVGLVMKQIQGQAEGNRVKEMVSAILGNT